MPSDVFISYATADESTALELCELLELQSLSCWIAKRNIVPGTQWAHALVQAIDDCRVLLVLVSEAANDSDSVAREIDLAYLRRRPILPLRTAKVEPTRGMAFYLGSTHYLDAYPKALAEYSNAIVRSVHALMLPRAAAAAPTETEAAAVAKPGTGPKAVAARGVAAEPTAVREVVGFDLGHGETAVAKAALDSEAHPTIVALGGKRNQVSALGFHPQLGFVLGEEAVLDPAVEAVLICFKELPSRNAMVRQIVREYLRAYYRVLLESGHICGANESHFFVGCPSGWSRDEIRLYEDTLREAGVPRLKVVKESRAALLNVVESGGITKDELKANVLLVDVGSSTTDLTLVIGGTTEAPMDFGIELGAALIDKQILQHALAAHPQRDELQEALAGDQTARERCEFLCRRVKEEYFSKEKLYRTLRRTAFAGIETVQGRIPFSPSVTAPLMDAILSEPLQALRQKSWTDAFHELLVEARERLAAHGCTPAAVVATGGASRMSFVQRICAEVFPTSKFRQDEEPEASIARGLALWGRVYLRTADFEAAVGEVADGQIPEIVTRRADDLVQQIASSSAEALIENAVRPTLLAWRSGEIMSIEGIEWMGQAKAKKWLDGPEFERVVETAVAPWYAPLRTEIDDLMDEVCRRYRIPKGSLSVIPKFRAVCSPTLNASDAVDYGLVETAITGVLGVLRFGNEWMVVNVALFVASEIFHSAWLRVALRMASEICPRILPSFKGKDIRERNIWKWVRSMILSDGKINDSIDEMKPKLRETLSAELKSAPALAEMSQQISSDLKAALLDRADDARVLIR
jgi:TIR domain/Hsp70 protein